MRRKIEDGSPESKVETLISLVQIETKKSSEILFSSVKGGGEVRRNLVFYNTKDIGMESFVTRLKKGRTSKRKSV